MFDVQVLRSRNEYPRTFLPPDARLNQWADIEPHVQSLLARSLDDRESLERYLLDLSELEAAISEEYSLRSIKSSCHTDDAQAKEAYLDYVQNVLPQTEPAFFQLQQKYLSAPALAALPAERFDVYTRARRTDVEVYRDENVPLQTDDAVLGQQYDELCGEQTVEFDGQVQTLPQMNRYLEETDRGLRERAWRAITGRRAADASAMEDIFDKMVTLRHRMALNAGLPSFIELQFKRLHRFDYTPADCEAFHTVVEKAIVPAARRLKERRKALLGVDQLKPWDLVVDPEGRPPLRPFQNAQELLDGVSKVLHQVDPMFDVQFNILRTNQLLDLESRKGKAPGGYQCSLEEVRLPFIFMNAAGRNDDVFTLIHEGGHALHALATRQEPILAYRSAPIEFCEVASMGMEMMACERLEAFYSADHARRARQMHLESVIQILPWIARVDAFQHWIYRNPKHTRAERRQQWLELEKRFGEDLEYPAEFDEWRGVNWVAKLHFFRVPLYYVEYGIAQLGALQLWNRFLDNPATAVKRYWAGLELGGSRPLPELFRAAGLEFSMEHEDVAPLVARLESALVA